MGLNVGDRLPDFRLEDQNGDQRSPESARGRGVVHVVYPKDDPRDARPKAAVFKATWMCF